MRRRLFVGAGVTTLLAAGPVTGLVMNLTATQAAFNWAVYKRGSSGENVYSIQYMLRHKGHNIAADGQFGPITESNVRSFQSKNSLTVDGIVGNNTWGKLIVQTKSGGTGNAVTALQRQLNRYGARLAVDGKFGPATLAATKSFQSSKSLTADGIAGPATWNKLVGTASSTPAPPPAKLRDINSFGSSIEGYAAYVGQSSCSASIKPGVAAFRSMFLAAFPATGDSGIVRNCGVGGQSEHKEGRAWDWRANVNNSTQVAQVNQALTWLFATDRYGHKHAMIRRLGIMYIIWNRRIWSAHRVSEGWRAYSGSNPHTDHVHFSFSWAGANKTTSYWK